MNRLHTQKQLAIVSAMVEGNSIRSIERMTGVHRDTIMRLLVRIGENCQDLMDQHIKGVHSKYLQADEIWTFVAKKEGRLSKDEKLNQAIGYRGSILLGRH